MTVDEAIEMYKKIANTDSNCPRYCMNPCEECVKECKQVSEWLEELKEYREIGTVQQCKNSVLDIERAYNKAIADFAERLCYKIKSEIDDCVDELQWVDEIAEQLKAGGENND